VRTKIEVFKYYVKFITTIHVPIYNKIFIFDKLLTNAVQTSGNSVVSFPTGYPYPGTPVSIAPFPKTILYQCAFPEGNSVCKRAKAPK
jgi:hypothetical protein